MRRFVQSPVFRPLLAFLAVTGAAFTMPEAALAQGSSCVAFCTSSCPTPPEFMCYMQGGTCGIGHTCTQGDGYCSFYQVKVTCLGGNDS